MRRVCILITLVMCAAPAFAQGTATITSAEPFKLGTFDIGGEPRIGIVLQDTIVVELNAANRALERNPAYPAIRMPDEMRAADRPVRVPA